MTTAPTSSGDGPRRGGSGGGSRSRGRERRQRPEPVGGLVGALLERWGVAHKVERARAVADWERIAGPHIARVTGGVKVRGRALIVEVHGASWLYELNIMRRELLERLNEGKSPRGRIEKIVFVQADGPEGKPERRGSRRTAGPASDDSQPEEA